MKTQIRSLLTLVCAVGASLLIIASPARAGYLVTLDQVGSNVVANGSGPIDLTGLTLSGGVHGGIGGVGIVQPLGSAILVGSGTGDIYFGPFSGPTNFGSGPGAAADSNTGSFAGMNFNGGVSPSLYVPVNYISGAAISDSSTYNNASFSSLGVTPGTYEWTWGTGANQNVTLQIGPASVPDAGSTFGLLALALAALFGASRFRSIRLA